MTKAEFIERYGLEEYQRKLEKGKERSKLWREKHPNARKEYYKLNKEKESEQHRVYNKQYYQDNKEYINKRNKEYYESNKEDILKQQKQYYQDNKEYISERGKEYRENNKVLISERKKEYRENNKERIKERDKQYYEDNKESILERIKEYSNTPIGKAVKILSHCKERDDARFGENSCDLTHEWIIENIVNATHCHYCGCELNFNNLSIDRKNSDLPHTKDNCVASCLSCNISKNNTPYDEYIKKIRETSNS